MSRTAAAQAGLLQRAADAARAMRLAFAVSALAFALRFESAPAPT